MDLDKIRREYLKGGLRRNQLVDDPMTQFERWMADAIEAELPDPTAMVLATVDSALQPHQRIVLLKGADSKGFVFFTNLGSAKAQQIEGNASVSLLFPWHMMERQIRVVGHAQILTKTETLKYFLTRPKESQLAAWASRQSHRIGSRQLLLQQFERMKSKFGAGEVPLPDFWGGFRVTPKAFEFWQGGASRLHDRFEYQQTDRGWQINRLAP